MCKLSLDGVARSVAGRARRSVRWTLALWALLHGLLVAGVQPVREAYAAPHAPKRVAFFYQDARLQLRQGEFREAMRTLGYVEGKNVQYEQHLAWTGRDNIDLAARHMVRTRPDLIFAMGTPPALAARRATDSIPILFYASNPVGTGLAASLAHPGANATGIASLADELSAKRLEILKEVAPSLRRVAILANTQNPATQQQLDALQVAAAKLGVQTSVLEFNVASRIESALRKLQRGRFDGVLLIGDVLVSVNQEQIAARALLARLPSIAPFDRYTKGGGLISYGPDLGNVMRRCAAYAARMLEGVRPQELPVEQAARFKLMVNYATAKRLGLSLPKSIDVRVDESVH